MNAGLLLTALLVLTAAAAPATAQAPKKPVPPALVHTDLLQTVRLRAAALRSSPIHLNSEPLHPLQAKPLFSGSSLPPVAMTDDSQSYVALACAPAAK